MIQRTKSFYLLAIALLVSPHAVTPASILVDGAGGTVATDGICTLPEAIDNANDDLLTHADCLVAGSGADDITLTTTVVLTERNSGPVPNGNGLPVIDTEMTIEGGDFSIIRDAGAPNFRIMAIVPGGIVTLNDVTISGGRIENTTGRSTGGGIFNNGGDLTMNNSTVSGNVAAAATTSLAYGGGIYAKGVSTTTLYNSTIADNSAEVIDVAMLGSAFVGGGGVSLCAVGCTGGGADDPALVLTNSTISGNVATIITPNPSTYQARAIGGGVYAFYGSLSLTNSTLSTNTVYARDYSGFGGGAYGGGILSAYADVYLVNSTLSGNESVAPYGDITGAGFEYFGFGAPPFPTIELSGTILGNHLTGYTCFFLEDSHNLGNNLADDDSCADIPDTLTGLNATLASNGGPTQTHSLMSGSSAIDAAGVCGLPTDQRGVPRSDGTCDSGSYEFAACAAPQGEDFPVPDGMTTTEETFETCNSITVNDRDIVGPNGHLILRTAGFVEFGNGFECGIDGKLTVENDDTIVVPDSQ